MSDILSASSLFLAALGLIYSTWYAGIAEASSIDLPARRLDRGPQISLLRRVLRGRALPLAAAACAAAIVLAPAFLEVAIECVSTCVEYRFGALQYYDSVKALFSVVYLLTLGLAAHTVGLAREVSGKLEAAQSVGA